MLGRLLIFCGIPGSGKTTIARLVAKSEPLAVLIQTDAMRSLVPEPNFSAEESDLVYRSAIAAAKVWLDGSRLVILDGTFGSARRRESTLAELSGHCSRVDFVQIICDLETALMRNSMRSGSAMVPPDRVKGILSAFEAPERAIIVDSSKLSPEAAAEMVVRELLYPLVPPE
jgi:predicted kinase